MPILIVPSVESSSVALMQSNGGGAALVAVNRRWVLKSKRLTHTPVRQAGSVLKCPDDRKNRVVSASGSPGVASHLWLRKEFPKSLFSRPRRWQPDTTPPAEKPVPGSAALGQIRGIRAVSSVTGNVIAESRPRRARSSLTSDPAGSISHCRRDNPSERLRER